MNYKYLIIKCEELMDGYECDCNRIPLKITEDYTKEDTDECEVYEILSNGTIGDCIKGYDEYSEEGFCLVFIPYKKEEKTNEYVVIEKYRKMKNKDFIVSKEFNNAVKKYFNGYNKYEIAREVNRMSAFYGDCDEYYNNKKGTFAFTYYLGKRICMPF